jgi:pimeloyl-ACP methyl ester carboxylesterase
MAELRSYDISVQGHPCRVLQAGAGQRVVYFAGIGGLPRWSPFLEALAKGRDVVAPSLPGFPGSPDFRHLDDYYAWIVATLEVLEQLGAESVGVIASSVAAPLLAEIAGLAPVRIRRLTLIAPFGIYDDAAPSADIWAQRPGPDTLPQLLCAKPEAWQRLWQKPADADAVEWGLQLTRAMEAAARFLFPLGNTGVEKRLARIHQPTLLVRGADDRVLPKSYFDRFAAGIAGPVATNSIANAGHAVELDQPNELAAQIHAFFADQQY